MAVATASPYVVLLALSAVVAAGLSVFSWRQRPETGATSLSALTLLIAVWCGSYAVGLVTPDDSLRILVKRVRWFGTAFVPVAWAVFALQYTGHESKVGRRLVASLGAFGLLTWVLAVLAPSVGLMWSSLDVVRHQGLVLVSSTRGPWFWAYLAFAVVLVVFGGALLFREGVTGPDLYADQSALLVTAGVVPVSAAILTNVGVTPVTGLDLTPYALGLAAVALGVAAFRFRLLELVPATRQVGRDAVVRNMRDGVVVLDDGDEVIDANPVAERALGRSRGDLVGKRAADVLDGVELGDDLSGQFVADDSNRTYEVRTSPMVGNQGRMVGTILVLRDVTDRRNREQRLTVLNRVLRHNFRNDMNAIDGYATMLAEDMPEPHAGTARQIREVSDEIMDLADKARDIEQLMSRRELDPRPVAFEGLVDSVVADVRQDFPDAEITVDLPDEAVSLPSRGIVEPVVSNLVENAAEHNDRVEPQVSLSVSVDRTDTPETLEIAVADDGPGIPEQERVVLLEGTETALKHGSGLGLWLVYWGVQSLDGDIDFVDNEPRGSVVTISIPLGPGRPNTAGADATVGTLEDAFDPAEMPPQSGD